MAAGAIFQQFVPYVAKLSLPQATRALFVFFTDSNAGLDLVNGVIDGTECLFAMAAFGTPGFIEGSTCTAQIVERTMHVALIGPCVLDQHKTGDGEGENSNDNGSGEVTFHSHNYIVNKMAVDHLKDAMAVVRL